jgi:hypothetical protein
MLAYQVDQQQVSDALAHVNFPWGSYIRATVENKAQEWLEEHYPCDDAVWTVEWMRDYSLRAQLSVIPGFEKES